MSPARAARRIVDWFCEGSAEALIAGMVDSKVLTRGELERLARRIAEAQASQLNPAQTTEAPTPKEAKR